jgi:hypothetical protein
MLADIISPVRKAALGGVGELVTRFYLLLVGMTVIAE